MINGHDLDLSVIIARLKKLRGEKSVATALKIASYPLDFQPT
jgi:hypothetical protein